ncbi:MAG: hypothetical protein HYY93_05805 [Planctomycetes bacterium]|nr:hypothetical protein [Planctomycetota bacterium]
MNRPSVLLWGLILSALSSPPAVLAQDSTGSANYVMEGVSTGESLSKADGIITSSSGFATTTVTGQSVNPEGAASGSFALNGDSGGGSGAPTTTGGGGGGGGGCFTGVVGSTGFPACASFLAAGLAGLLIRRRRV